jgi:transposase InsO family protein
MKNDKNQYKSYKEEVVGFVDSQLALGRKLGPILANIDISKASYFSWKRKLENPPEVKEKLPHPLQLTPAEEQLVVSTKLQHMDKRHRHIQGILQNEGCFVSCSSVFKILKKNALVETFERREAPWKKPRYEIAKRNCMWGTDWTKIKISHETWHLLTLIDFYSRKIVDWQIVPEVNSSHIKAIYQSGLSKENLLDAARKPKLRADLGAPNKSRATQEFVLAISGDLPSFARVRRPTDNAITERFYGTIKQEEIYVVGSYPDLKSAQTEITAYMAYYNNERPHQSLWNFIPAYVHDVNNKSEILAERNEMKFSARNRRREYWAFYETMLFQQRILREKQAQLNGQNYTQKSPIWSTIEKA